ncbi:UNVERIFIED_CONTAM: hypothetical protein HDU68_010286 [Siphonaria sp. JEL0065]|nr:hypothetical protein HDU68_010286 [Siphonaria sp. JEL0065]
MTNTKTTTIHVFKSGHAMIHQRIAVPPNTSIPPGLSPDRNAHPRNPLTQKQNPRFAETVAELVKANEGGGRVAKLEVLIGGVCKILADTIEKDVGRIVYLQDLEGRVHVVGKESIMQNASYMIDTDTASQTLQFSGDACVLNDAVPCDEFEGVHLLAGNPHLAFQHMIDLMARKDPLSLQQQQQLYLQRMQYPAHQLQQLQPQQQQQQQQQLLQLHNKKQTQTICIVTRSKTRRFQKDCDIGLIQTLVDAKTFPAWHSIRFFNKSQCHGRLVPWTDPNDALHPSFLTESLNINVSIKESWSDAVSRKKKCGPHDWTYGLKEAVGKVKVRNNSLKDVTVAIKMTMTGDSTECWIVDVGESAMKDTEKPVASDGINKTHVVEIQVNALASSVQVVQYVV